MPLLNNPFPQILLGPSGEWREDWKRAKDGIEIFLSDYQRNGISTRTTDWPYFKAMQGPLRRWSGTVLYFIHEREGALGQLEGYAPIDDFETVRKIEHTLRLERCGRRG